MNEWISRKSEYESDRLGYVTKMNSSKVSAPNKMKAIFTHVPQALSISRELCCVSPYCEIQTSEKVNICNVTGHQGRMKESSGRLWIGSLMIGLEVVHIISTQNSQARLYHRLYQPQGPTGESYHSARRIRVRNICRNAFMTFMEYLYS